MDMTWLGKWRKKDSFTASISPVLVRLLPCAPPTPKWDYVCMKQEVRHSPTIHQSLGGRVCVQKFVFSAGALAMSMHMWVGVMKCVGVQYEFVCVCVCLYFLWGLETRANSGGGGWVHAVQLLHHAVHQAHERRHAWEGFNILCVCDRVCVFVGLCLLKEWSSLYLSVCLVYYRSTPHTCVLRQIELRDSYETLFC